MLLDLSTAFVCCDWEKCIVLCRELERCFVGIKNAA